MIGVVSGLELEEDEVERTIGGEEKYHLHDSVVGRDKVGEDVQVACGENHSKENLTLPRNTYGSGVGRGVRREERM